MVTEFLLNAGVPLVETFRLPLLAGAFGLLLVALWANRGYPGMILVFIGILSNAVVIVVNGGYMPIWEPALTAAGLTPADVTTALHYILPPPLDANFLLHLGPFADVIPIPVPIIQNVASIGDVFLMLGLAFFLFAAVVRSPQELDEADLAIIRERLAVAGAPTRPRRAGDPGAETGLSPALTAAVALERPLACLGQRRPRVVIAVARAASKAATPRAAPAGTAPRRRARWPPQTPGAQGLSIAAPAMSAALHGGTDRRCHPPASLCSPRPQPIVLGVVGGPASSRSSAIGSTGSRCVGRRVGRSRRASALRDGPRLLRGHAAEPAARARSPAHVRRPLGPQGSDGRQPTCGCEPPRSS